MTMTWTSPAASGTDAAGPRNTSSVPPGIGVGVAHGDGTNFRSRTRSRWQRVRGPLGIAAVLLTFVIIAGLARPATTQIYLSPTNPGPNGAQALAKVLGRQGVDVTSARTVADAVAAARAGGTLLVIDSGWLEPDQVQALVDTPGDLVVVDPSDTLLEAATEGEAKLRWTGSAGRRWAECDDPDAVAAHSITSPAHGGFHAPTAGTLCFPDESGSGAFLVHSLGDRTVRALYDGEMLANEHILDTGNAALGLRMLGHRDQLVWLVHDTNDDSLTTPRPTDNAVPEPTVPRNFGVVLLWAAAVVLVAALWRVRRLGPLVTERLPVAVRASETTLGRGRLYRRARSRGHAAAGLRARAADRIGHRLGLPRSTAAPTLIDAVVRATGRNSADVAALFYGPPPADDAALLDLARRLDLIESEVYHS